MVATLALVEGIGIFAALCAVRVLLQPVRGTWIDMAIVVGEAFVLSVGCLFALYYAGLYDLRAARRFARFAMRPFCSLVFAALVLSALHAAVAHRRASWTLLVWSLLALVAVLPPLRAACYRLIRRRHSRVLILGTGSLAQKIALEIEAQACSGYTVIGVADDAAPLGEPLSRYPLFGPLAHLGKFIAEARPDRIVIALTQRRGQLPVAELLECRARGIVVEEGADVYERLTGRLALESLVPSALIFSKNFRHSRLKASCIRLMSLAVSMVALVVLAPLFGLIALAIKCDSRGPVFFAHDRMGVSGKRFKLIKFRTMHPAGANTSEWVRDNVDRITPLGKWLRKFHLDELPQFVNVLRGDMNLVGPRPHPVSNFQLFAERIPYYPLRAMVRPGVTGWAQIRYRYANSLEEEAEKMRYDLYYIKHRSIWLDLRILVDTVKFVLVGHGSSAPEASPLETGERLKAA